MKIKEACQRYFTLTKTAEKKELTRREKSINGLKIVSYIFIAPPLFMGIVYGVSLLLGRVKLSKNNQSKKTAKVAKSVLKPNVPKKNLSIPTSNPASFSKGNIDTNIFFSNIKNGERDKVKELFSTMTSEEIDGLQDEKGNTALHYAVKFNDKPMVELFLSKMTFKTINVKNTKGRTPLDYAIGYKGPNAMNLEIVDLLLTVQKPEDGKRVNDVELLIRLISCKDVNLTKKLLLRMTPEEINKVTSSGPKLQITKTTILHSAVREENYNTEIIKILLPLLTEDTVNVVNGYSGLALNEAIRREDLEVIALILEKTSRITSHYYSEIGPRHYDLHPLIAIIKTGNQAILKLFLDHMKLKGGSGEEWSSWVLATIVRSEGITKDLLAFVLDYFKENGIFTTSNFQDNEGNTLLHHALSGNSVSIPEVIEFIIGKMTPEGINRRNNNNYTALHYAAYRGNKEVLKMILPLCTDETFNTRAQESKGYKKVGLALNYAIIRGEIEIISLLLERTEITKQREGGKLHPLSTIIEKGDKGILGLFLNHINFKEGNYKKWGSSILAILVGSDGITEDLLEFVLEYFKDNGIFTNFDFQDQEGKTLLHHALNKDRKSCSSPVIKFLLDKMDPFFINAQDRYGFTALMLATERECFQGEIPSILEKMTPESVGLSTFADKKTALSFLKKAPGSTSSKSIYKELIKKALSKARKRK